MTGNRPRRLAYDNGMGPGRFKLHLYDVDAPEPHVDLVRTYMEFGLAINASGTAGSDPPLGMPGLDPGVPQPPHSAECTAHAK